MATKRLNRRASLGALGAGVLAFATVWSGTAFAQTPPQCPASEVDGLEDEGLRLRREGHDEAALVLFRQSYDRCHGPRALVRMASAEGALGRWLDADAHLREGAAATNDPWVVANRAHITTDLETVGGHIGELELLGTGPTATVLVDGRPAGSWPTHGPIRVIAGTVTYTVQAAGYVAVTRTVSIPARATDREQVTLLPVPAPVTTVTEPPPRPDPTPVVTRPGEPTVPAVRHVPANGTLMALGVVSTVLAVTGLVVGSVISVGRTTADSDYQTNHCTPASTTNCADLYSTAYDSSPTQVVGFVAGGVFAAASVALFWVGAGHDETPGRTAWNCAGGPGTVGLRCGMSF